MAALDYLMLYTPTKQIQPQLVITKNNNNNEPHVILHQNR